MAGTWPSSLPQYMEIGLSDDRSAGFVRTNPEAGPPKQRPRFTRTYRTLSGTMLMTAAQRATFETFYSSTINEGGDTFTMPDPLDGTTGTFQFVEPPSFRALVGGASGAALWRASLRVMKVD